MDFADASIKSINLHVVWIIVPRRISTIQYVYVLWIQVRH